MMTFEEKIKDDFKRKIWAALEDVAREFPDIDERLHQEAMEEGIEHFMIHFYEDNKED